MTTKRTVLITGATSGIGEATARLLAQHSFRLILCGRRRERLDKLAKELSANTEVTTLSFDVRHKDEVVKAISSLGTEWSNISVLINNAGGAHGLDPIQTGKTEDWDAMIDSNVKGLLYVSHEIIPGMVARKEGHIINLGSIAGKEVYPNGNVYCAAKFAVDALTRAMRIDLVASGIKVTSISPGMVETEFAMVRFKGDEARASQVYKGLEPLHSDDIADLILFCLTRRNHVSIADITVFPTAQASAAVSHRQ